MNENNLQNNQMGNTTNQNPQPINNTNQTINTKPNPSVTSSISQPSPSVNSSISQPNPSVTSSISQPRHTVNSSISQPSPSVASSTSQPNPSVTSSISQPNPSVNSSTSQPSPSVTSSISQPSPSVTSSISQPRHTVNSSISQPSPSVASSTSQPSHTVNSSISQPSPSVASSTSQPNPSVNSSTSQPSLNVSPTSNNQQELNIVNPLNPDETIKTETLVEKKVTEESDNINNNNDITEEKPKKKKLNPILLILLVVVIVAVGVVLYFTFFNKSESPSTPNTPSTPETPTPPQITLNDILNNFNSNETINQLRETSDITASINDNQIIIDVATDEQSKNYIFTLENRELIFEIDQNDLVSNLLFIIICDNIGQFHGLESSEVANYLSSIDLNTTSVNGITLIQSENGTYQARINIDTKIDTSSLNTMYIELSDLESYRDFIEGSGTAQLQKGNLMFYKEGNENTSTILIAEKDNLTELTYNSILSVIELLYPNDLANFKTSYPSLETISFDRYTITINPELNGSLQTLYSQYENEYKFILIEINKSL